MGLRFVLPLVMMIAFAGAQQPTVSAAPDTGLPDVRTLMQQVEQHQREAEALQRDYTWHVHTVKTTLDKAGHPKKTTTLDADSLTIDSVRVEKVVARDGKPLTPEQARKEDEAVDKTVAQAKQRRAKREQKNQPTDAEGDEVLTLSRLFELGTFSNLRAGTFDGRPAWLIDYAGDPHAKTRNEFEGIMRDVVGTLWMDQQDKVLVALDGHFVKDFKIGAGLVANIHQGTTFRMRQAKVDDAVWLPAAVSGKGSVRFLLLFNFNGRLDQQMSEYKKFRTTTTILPTDHVARETTPK